MDLCQVDNDVVCYAFNIREALMCIKSHVYDVRKSHDTEKRKHLISVYALFLRAASVETTKLWEGTKTSASLLSPPDMSTPDSGHSLLVSLYGLKKSLGENSC